MSKQTNNNIVILAAIASGTIIAVAGTLRITPADLNWGKVQAEEVAFSAQVAVVMMIPLFFPYAFLQHENSQRIAAGFILIFTLILAAIFIDLSS